MNQRKLISPVVFLFCCLVGTACCKTPAASVAATAPLANQAVTLEGKNYCLGCALKKAHGAAAQCSTYGHRHALQVVRAQGATGSELPSLVGQSLHYLDNDQSSQLLSGGAAWHNAQVKVVGRLFGAENTLEVMQAEPL